MSTIGAIPPGNSGRDESPFKQRSSSKAHVQSAKAAKVAQDKLPPAGNPEISQESGLLIERVTPDNKPVYRIPSREAIEDTRERLILECMEKNPSMNRAEAERFIDVFY